MTTGPGDWFKAEMRFKDAVRASAELGRREVEDHRDAAPEDADSAPQDSDAARTGSNSPAPQADEPRRGPYVHPSSDQSSDRA